ncbi:MAG TPA: hypothetical protein VMD78_08095 [Candidatus Baltobacteraceae bacterium]|nr:hypothetical protein [Candidatus Baltobacteraceae bacterium]
MLRATNFRTWAVIAALTVAVLYGSFCSTACAIAALPIGAPTSHCEKCGRERQPDSSHSRSGPSDHNCGRHVHPTDFVESAGAPHVHLDSARAAHLVASAIVNLRADSIATGWRSTGVGPPGRSKAPLPENFSILRI